jgi:DNA-binding LacI/PurR family transcriptional regulator
MDGNPSRMHLKVDRISLIDQTAKAVREGILAGDWTEWLPSERSISHDLGVGRNTLRAALRILVAEGLIHSVPRQGIRIARNASKPAARRNLVVGVLSPSPIEVAYPRKIIWIDALRDQLARDGYILKYYSGNQFLRAGPERAIERLVKQERCDCWMLVASTHTVQNWFMQNGIPCQIAGSCHPGIDLPFVDIDYRAVCRHAVVTLWRSGHQKVIYLTPPPQLAGDIRSETGFLQGVKECFGARRAAGSIEYTESSVEPTVHAVNRLMRRSSRPTALLVNNPFQYLAVFSALAKLGLGIPEEVSLICRGADHFLSYLTPAPARYVQNPLQFAGKLFQSIRKVINNLPLKERGVLLMPDYLEGGSVSRPGS